MSRKPRKHWAPAKGSMNRKRDQQRERHHNKGTSPHHQEPDLPSREEPSLPPPPPPSPAPVRPLAVELPTDLRVILPDGVKGGFRWETYGQVTHSIAKDHPENKISRIYQHLLHFPRNQYILQYLVNALQRTNADHVASCLAELFDIARDMVHRTLYLKPDVFYTLVVEQKEWARNIHVGIFSRFVTSLVFGRSLYKDLVHEVDQRLCDNPLAGAIDRFVASFLDYYHVPMILCEENWKLFSAKKSRAREKYYQYFHGTQSWTEGLLDCEISEERVATAYDDCYEWYYAAKNTELQPALPDPEIEEYHEEINYDYEDWEVDHQLVSDYDFNAQDPLQFDEDADDVEAAEGYTAD
ncbi:hypothetical protein GGR57DRAFT_501738 [Xylariaceae sp. FL1272]|nr:hypothetical protein GGR57DRAFT_501738 [Xylariaceae sp. FL1272]